MNIKTWQEVSKQFTLDRRAMATNQMIWMQQEIDELRAAYEAQKQRAYALALAINDLTRMVTYEGETKEDFIKRVKSILSVNPDLRVDDLQKENAELQKNLESEKLANTRLAEIIKENNAKMSAGVYTTNEQYAKEVKEHDDLLTAIEALEIKHEGALDSIRQYKQILEGVPEEGAFESGWTARGIMKHAADLERDNAAQAKRIEELEAATQHLGLTPQQAADGLARHKAQVAEIEAQAKRIAELENELVEKYQEPTKDE